MRTLGVRQAPRYAYRVRTTVRGRSWRCWLNQKFGRAVGTLREWRRRRISRTALASFDERMLRDIGLTRADAHYEINKPFWRE